MSKPHLSASSLAMLWRCGEQWRRRYVEKERVPPGIAAHAGTGVHRSAAANLKAKARSGVMLPRDEVKQLARDEFVNRLEAEGADLTPEEAGRGLQAVRDEYINRAVRLADLHYTDLAPSIQPISEHHVEREWRVELQGFPFDLLGYIDVQTATSVRDAKTRAKAPSHDEAHTSEQLTMYAIGVKVVDGALPESLALDCLVDTATPKLVTLETRRTSADVDMQLRRIERAAQVIERGWFTPADPSSWWCSEKFCGYAKTCPFYQRRPLMTAVTKGAKR